MVCANFSLVSVCPSFYLFFSLSYSPHLSLSLPLLSLSASFPPFLSFHLRLFNLYNDHSPSSLSPSDYNRCTNLLCFLGMERTVVLCMYCLYLSFCQQCCKGSHIWCLVTAIVASVDSSISSPWFTILLKDNNLKYL